MRIPLFQVDAFSGRAFGGNPAAVALLEAWLPDATLQAIAAENNLSETAYLVPHDADYELRWFTPEMEVDLCGHATLAAGKIVLDELRAGQDLVRFDSRSGPLAVRRTGELFELDFPAQPGEPVDISPALVEAMGREPNEVWRSVHYDLLVYETEDDVAGLSPDEARLVALEPALGIIASAPGDSAAGVDFVSRFFAPKAGIFEDPVTGSAHCVSTPYWAERLGKERLEARQISRRGGELTCTLRGDRVAIAGRATLFLRGEIELE